MHGHDDLGDSRHPHHVGAHCTQHPVLGARLEVGTGDGHVDALAQHDPLAPRFGPRQLAQRRVVRLRHVGEARTEPVVIRTDQWIVAQQVDVVRHEHQVTRRPQRVHPPACIRDHERAGA